MGPLASIPQWPCRPTMLLDPPFPSPGLPLRRSRHPSPSRRREVGEEDDPGVEPLHVLESHPDGSSVAEHVDVSLAPDQRVQVHFVLVDQTPFGEGVGELAAPMHKQVTIDLVLQLRYRVLELPREQGRVPLEIPERVLEPTY